MLDFQIGKEHEACAAEKETVLQQQQKDDELKVIIGDLTVRLEPLTVRRE